MHTESLLRFRLDSIGQSINKDILEINVKIFKKCIV